MTIKSSWLRPTRKFCLITSIVLTGFVGCSEGDSDASKPNPEPEPEPKPEIPAIAPTVCDFDLNEDALLAAGWTKSFEDDFSGDLSQWNVWTGGAFNNELQAYLQSNLKVEDGKLIIAARPEDVTAPTNPFDATPRDFEFTSGRIECKTNISASASTPKVRIVARIKLPAGYALWPAFWSYGDPWPTQGEIDIVEFRGTETKKYQTNYFYGSSAGANQVSGAEKVITTNADITTCYHVYEMIWEKTKLTSILDGTVVEVKTSGGFISSMFGKQQRVVLNLAVGGAFFSSVDPSLIVGGEMIVDWVKVYTSN